MYMPNTSIILYQAKYTDIQEVVAVEVHGFMYGDSMQSQQKPIKPIKIFLSYSQKDERYKNYLLDHLSAILVPVSWTGR